MNKIAMVCHRYYPDIGGVETHVQEISERLSKRGFEVEVICTDSTWKYPENEEHNGIKITRFKSLAPKNAFYLAPQIYFYIKEHDFDIVHAHNYHAFPAFFASRATDGRFIFNPYYHGSSHSPFRNLLLKPYRSLGQSIFEKAEKIICLSRFEMKLIQNDFNIQASKFIIIPPGLNRDEFENIPDMKNGSKSILFAGRLESYKGVQYIIEALSLLEDYKLMIIGSGNYERELRDLARKLNLNDRIEWLEHVTRKELLSDLKSADVFVNLSTLESYGITVAEALASGTPCIVAKGSALEEFIDGESCIGMQYPIDLKVLAFNIRRLKKIRPREMPDWDDVTSQLINLYTFIEV
jgi:glycosyltransferase involved in cell wall biosynthesis